MNPTLSANEFWIAVTTLGHRLRSTLIPGRDLLADPILLATHRSLRNSLEVLHRGNPLVNCLLNDRLLAQTRVARQTLLLWPP